MLAAAAAQFPAASTLRGFDVDATYVERCRERLNCDPRAAIERADFFTTDWRTQLAAWPGELLVVGNFPWVTNSTQGGFGGTNLPAKSNFQGRRGIEAITGASNFDVSEWMLNEACSWFTKRRGTLAMLVKRSVVRRVIAHACDSALAIEDVCVIDIDARRAFDASVAACLFVVRFAGGDPSGSKYQGDHRVFASFDEDPGTACGRRDGLMIRDLDAYERHRAWLGTSPLRWRSGIKHDAAAVMELIRSDGQLRNGRGELVDIEPDIVFPLRKGAEIGSGKPWGERFVIVPQRRVGEPTDSLRETCPRTYAYLLAHAPTLDARRSSIYAKNPRFSIFGIGDYAFAPFKIAICGLYKRPAFRLQGPLENRPVMFDDTTTYLSFADEASARAALARLESPPIRELLDALIFPDDKRPVKASLLNRIVLREALTP